MSKIFVTGGHGFLGQYLLPLLRGQGYEVVAPTEGEFNITTSDTYRFVCGKTYGYFDIVINLAAYTNVPGAERDLSTAVRVNTAVQWLAHLPPQCQVFHMSTDYVYDGNSEGSSEYEIPRPFNNYGLSKAMADSILLSYCAPNIHIIRTSFKPVKWPYPMAFTDVRTNADTVDVIAGMLAHFILAGPPGGVWNIGTEPKTVYELAKRNNPNVCQGWAKDIPYLRPNVTMDLTKYHAWRREALQSCLTY